MIDVRKSPAVVHAVIGPCSTVRDFLLDYLDGRLSLWRRWRFRLHLRACAPCRAYLERYNSSVKLAQNALGDPPPPELVDLTLRFLHQPGTKR